MKKILMSVMIIAFVFSTSCNSKSEKQDDSDKKQKITFVENDLDKSIDVLIEGELFTTFRWPDNMTKPVLHPILTSAGTEITRGFPIETKVGERVDHPHQIGMWLTYGNVDGNDFWGNGSKGLGTKNENGGTIKHLQVEKLTEGLGEGALITSESWIVGITSEDDEEVAEKEAKQEQVKQEKEDKKAAKEKEKADKLAEEEAAEEKEEESKTVEHDNLEFGEFTMEEITTEINDNELTFSFRWINQSGKEKLPFTAVGYIDVHQGDELLDETSDAYDVDNKTGILFKNALGGGHKVTLTYKLENDEPIRIRIGATHEIDNTKEEIVIEDLE